MSKRGQTPNAIFEPCRGGGVHLRAPKWADYDDWVALRRNNKDYLKPWEPSWDDAQLTRSAYRVRLAKFKKLISGDKAYPFHIFQGDSGHLVGACNLMSVKRGSMQSAHIGYWVGEKYSRQGLARAAVSASLRFAFTEINLHRVEAAVRAENTASIKLLEATGFQKEGIARGMLKIDGRWHDHLIYARLSGD